MILKLCSLIQSLIQHLLCYHPCAPSIFPEGRGGKKDQDSAVPALKSLVAANVV